MSVSEIKAVTMDFSKLKRAVAHQFARMCAAGRLFTSRATGDHLWEAYLSSFPDGTNPVLRKRTDHDCSCCRSFIKRVGGVVAIVEGHKIETIWDIKHEVDPGYRAVASAMALLVRRAGISGVFLTPDASIGTDRNYDQVFSEIAEGKKKADKTKVWEHFFLTMPASCVAPKDEIGPRTAAATGSHDVFARALENLTKDAVDTVTELISQGSLYRGVEQSFVLSTFAACRSQYFNTDVRDRDAFVWERSLAVSGSVSGIRNTALGTLLTNLSEGMELESAVKAWDSIMAPANYKRPTALVSKAQVEKARQAIVDLGLSSALDRRYATIDDVAVNNLLFVDRSPRNLDADVFDDIAVKPVKKLDRIEDIHIDKFIEDVLPKISSLEVFLDNDRAPNMVSLVAPVDPGSGMLFKWPNRFSWSYNGDFADSIRDRVKKAGGNVTGELCCRLAWNYDDDLDLRMEEPGGVEVYYCARRSRAGGFLDVDANGSDGIRPNPVENICYEKIDAMPCGVYALRVNNYRRRDASARGFQIEIDILGRVTTIEYGDVLRDRETVTVATLRRTPDGLEIVNSLPSKQSPMKIWGLDTQQYHRVRAMMLSPNHWDGHGVGNKHFFFMLDNCVSDGGARGFFNEFLKEDLNPHRKVIEIVGSKMKTDTSRCQLSGLGFSSTQRNNLLCRVKGSFTRVLNINF